MTYKFTKMLLQEKCKKSLALPFLVCYIAPVISEMTRQTKRKC